MSLKTYYHKYLGYNGKDLAVSPQRDLPLNRFYYYRVIATEIEGKAFYSISQALKDTFQIKGSMKETIECNKENLEVRTFLRMTLKSYQKPDKTLARVWTYEDFNLALSKIDASEHQALKRDHDVILKQGRRFVIEVEGHHAGYGKVSDLDHKGANIAVYVNPAFRKRGYGRMLVAACVDWCLENDYLPIYLVDASNTASIKLAQSLGFETFSKEYALSEEIR